MDSRNHATRRRQERQEALREYLSERAKLSQIIDNIEKMENEGAAMEAQELQALKYATESRIKLLAKYLPDLKSVELSGDSENPVEVVQRIERKIVKAGDNTSNPNG